MSESLNVAVIGTAKTAELPAALFGVQTNIPLIHQVVVAQQAAARQGTHSTKTRGEVRGGRPSGFTIVYPICQQIMRLYRNRHARREAESFCGEAGRNTGTGSI